MIELRQLLTPATVSVGLEGRTKEEVLNGLIDLLNGRPLVTDLEEVRRAVLERERIMSTGVGKGLALPHAKTRGVEDTQAAFAVTENPIDFSSIDNKPVRMLFLLVGNEISRSTHIRLLSRISRLMNRDAFREQLLRAGSAHEICRLFAEGEAEYIEQ